eukprot:TRINITY_DN3014_c0_g1_i1.p1 TRINITY_DN3014_c0_g1~~TRINITY_DN3014_c0_g1_i1.p1  ORF type:complete len:178 (+),score=53.48 TRINITY_DN3014_c0_g1_i1:216-749(+)
MEAHRALHLKGMSVDSFGTGRHCKLPGTSANDPVIFPFGKAYAEMLTELQSENNALYSQNGVLEMLERNAATKPCPQKWQEHDRRYEVVLTFEREIFNAVLADVQERGERSESMEPVHIINIEVKDRKKEAEVGAKVAVDLCELLQESEDIEDEIEPLLKEFEARSGHAILHTMMFW